MISDPRSPIETAEDYDTVYDRAADTADRYLKHERSGGDVEDFLIAENVRQHGPLWHTMYSSERQQRLQDAADTRPKTGFVKLTQQIWKELQKYRRLKSVLIVVFVARVVLIVADFVFDWVFYAQLQDYALAPGIATRARQGYMYSMIINGCVIVFELLMIYYEVSNSKLMLRDDIYFPFLVAHICATKNNVCYGSYVALLFEEVPLTILIVLIVLYGANCSLVMQFLFTWQSRTKLIIGVVAFAKRVHTLISSYEGSYTGRSGWRELVCQLLKIPIFPSLIIFFFVGCVKVALVLASFVPAIAHLGIQSQAVHAHLQYGTTYAMHLQQLHLLQSSNGLTYFWNTTNTTIFHGMISKSADISLDIINHSKADFTFPCSEIIQSYNNPLPEINTSLIQSCTVYIALKYYPKNNTIAYNAIYELTLGQWGHVCFNFINREIQMPWSQDGLSHAARTACNTTTNTTFPHGEISQGSLTNHPQKMPEVTCAGWCHQSCTRCHLISLTNNTFQSADNCTCMSASPGCTLNQCLWTLPTNCSSLSNVSSDYGDGIGFENQPTPPCHPVPISNGSESCFLNQEAPQVRFTQDVALNLLGPLSIEVVGCQDPPAFYDSSLPVKSHCG